MLFLSSSGTELSVCLSSDPSLTLPLPSRRCSRASKRVARVLDSFSDYSDHLDEWYRQIEAGFARHVVIIDF